MERDKKIIRTSVLGIGVNIILVAFKALVGVLANSIAVIMDAINNLSDALSSVITIIGTKLSGKKPDKKHPYGHGRVEYITSVVIALIIFIAGASALYQSVLKIITPEETDYKFYSLLIIAVAVLVKFFFGAYVKGVGKKLNSSSLVASGTDAFFDGILSFSTLVAAIISLAFGLNLEGWFGAAIAIFILKSGFDILRETLSSIIGVRADEETVKELKKMICDFKEVRGVYDVTLHNYGPTRIIGSAHIEVADDLSARIIHKLSRKITVAVYEKTGIILTVGIYAAGNTSPVAIKMKNDLERIIAEEGSIKEMHAFYFDEDQKSVSFDLIVDFSADAVKEKNEIVSKIKNLYPDYEYSVILDTDFSD